jgi:3-hydroxyisobutyrate dehydrogenase
MARHLAAKGHDVTVWNRTEAKARAWAEANEGKAAATPAAAIAGASYIFMCLGDDPDVQSVFDAFAPSLQAGQVIWNDLFLR